jgi:hypothetical protein
MQKQAVYEKVLEANLLLLQISYFGKVSILSMPAESEFAFLISVI